MNKVEGHHPHMFHTTTGTRVKTMNAASNVWHWTGRCAKRNLLPNHYADRKYAINRRLIRGHQAGQGSVGYALGWPGRVTSRSVISFFFAMNFLIRFAVALIVVPSALVLAYVLLNFQIAWWLFQIVTRKVRAVTRSRVG